MNLCILLIILLIDVLGVLYLLLKRRVVVSSLDVILRSKGFVMLEVLFLFLLLVFINLYAIVCLVSGIEFNASTFVTIYTLFTQTQGANSVGTGSNFLQLLYVGISFVGALVFSGILVSTVTNYISQRIELVSKGEIRYAHIADHYLVFGVNDYFIHALTYVLNKIDKESRVIVISEMPAESVREKLVLLPRKDIDKIIIYNETLQSELMFSHLNLRMCIGGIILGDKPARYSDYDNLRLINNLYNYVEKNDLRCTKERLLFEASLYDDTLAIGTWKNFKTERITFTVINFAALWASRIWGYGRKFYHYDNYAPLYYKGDESVHLIILGSNLHACELVKMALKLPHNCDEITLISNDTEEMDYFKLCFSRSFEDSKGRVNFICQSPVCSETMQYIEHAAENENLYIAICTPDSNVNLVASTHLPVTVYENKTPIVVLCDNNSEAAVTSFSEVPMYRNIRLYGYCDTYQHTAKILTEAMKLKYLWKHSEYKPEEAENEWYSFTYDNVRKRFLELINLYDYADDINSFCKAYQEHYIAVNLLSGYKPTDSPDDDSDFEVKRVNTLFEWNKLASHPKHAMYCKSVQLIFDIVQKARKLN